MKWAYTVRYGWFSVTCLRSLNIACACFPLGHRSYEPGTTTYSQLVSAFGKDVVGEDGQINRRQLAARVFSNKVRMCNTISSAI